MLEALVSKKRDRKAALKLLRKLMKRSGRPDAIVTDRLRPYRVALRELGASGLQQAGRWLNNRAENSHLPFRRREHALLRFRRMPSLQKFVAVHSSIYNHFNLRRHLCSRDNFKLNRAAALAEWRRLVAAQFPVVGGELRPCDFPLTGPQQFLQQQVRRRQQVLQEDHLQGQRRPASSETIGDCCEAQGQGENGICIGYNF